MLGNSQQCPPQLACLIALITALKSVLCFLLDCRFRQPEALSFTSQPRARSLMFLYK